MPQAGYGVLLLLAADAVDAMQLHKMPIASPQIHNSYALDGSTYVYFAPSNPTRYADWIIFLEGGGECETSADCHQRAASELGSAAYLPSKYDSDSSADGLSDGILDDGLYNPFHAWGKLYLPYLSGDDWLANNSQALDPWSHKEADNGTLSFANGTTAAKPLWFCGGSNFVAAIEQWLSSLATPPKRVLLSGASAGGQGAFFHADRLRSMLPPATIVKANPQYGWFEPLTDRYPDWKRGKHTDPSIPYPSSASPIAVPPWTLHPKMSLMLPERCVASLPSGTSPMRCSSTPIVAKTIAVPLFVSTNLFDAWTTDVQEEVPTTQGPKLGPTASADPRLEYLLTVTAPAIAGTVANVSTTAVSSSAATAVAAGDRGAFVPPCLAHPMDWSAAGGTTQHSLQMGGCTHAEAVASWFFGTRRCPRALIADVPHLTVAKMAVLHCNRGRFKLD